MVHIDQQDIGFVVIPQTAGVLAILVADLDLSVDHKVDELHSSVDTAFVPRKGVVHSSRLRCFSGAPIAPYVIAAGPQEVQPLANSIEILLFAGDLIHTVSQDH